MLISTLAMAQKNYVSISAPIGIRRMGGQLEYGLNLTNNLAAFAYISGTKIFADGEDLKNKLHKEISVIGHGGGRGVTSYSSSSGSLLSAGLGIKISVISTDRLTVGLTAQGGYGYAITPSISNDYAQENLTFYKESVKASTLVWQTGVGVGVKLSTNVGLGIGLNYTYVNINVNSNIFTRNYNGYPMFVTYSKYAENWSYFSVAPRLTIIF